MNIDVKFALTSLPSDMSSYVTDLCLDRSIDYSLSDVCRSLETLKRLWPERHDELCASHVRGIAVIVPSVELGCILANCQGLAGFQRVLFRLRSGERSAYSELVLASSLARLGFTPEFEVPLNGKTLDARCQVDNHPVYFEVFTPDQSQRSSDTRAVVSQLTEAIEAVVARCRVEVTLFAVPGNESIHEIARVVATASSGIWCDIGSVARARRIDEGQVLPATFDRDGTQIVFGGQRTEQGSSVGIVIRWEETDERARSQFRGEYHHFSTDVANILVVNSCAASGGLEAWKGQVQGIFQPTMNRKVGAIVTFQQGILGPPEAIRRRWHVSVNPYAHMPVPERLLKAIRTLDDPMFGLP